MAGVGVFEEVVGLSLDLAGVWLYRSAEFSTRFRHFVHMSGGHWRGSWIALFLVKDSIHRIHWFMASHHQSQMLVTSSVDPRF